MRCGSLILHGFSQKVRNVSPRLVLAESVSDHDLGSAYQSSVGGDDNHTLNTGYRSSFYHQLPFDQLAFPRTMSTAQFPVQFLEYQRFVEHQQSLAQLRSLEAAAHFRTTSSSAPQQPDVANQGNMSQPDNSVYNQAEKRDEYANEKLRMVEIRLMGSNQKHHEAIRLFMQALDDFQPSGQPKHLTNLIEDVMADQNRSEKQYQLSHIRYQAEPECVCLVTSVIELVLPLL